MVLFHLNHKSYNLVLLEYQRLKSFDNLIFLYDMDDNSRKLEVYVFLQFFFAPISISISEPSISTLIISG